MNAQASRTSTRTVVVVGSGFYGSVMAERFANELGWKVVVLNMPNIAPVSGLPLGVVFVAVLICSVGMGILLLNSMYSFKKEPISGKNYRKRLNLLMINLFIYQW